MIETISNFQRCNCCDNLFAKLWNWPTVNEYR